MQAKPKTSEYYVIDKIQKHGITVEVETDCVTYEDKTGQIIQWQCWSEHFNDWMELNLDLIQEKWPTAFLRMQNKIDELVYEEKQESEAV